MKNFHSFLSSWLTAILVVTAGHLAMSQTTVGPFTFYPTNLGGTMQGQAQIGGVPAVSGDIIAAFDPSNECVGAAALIINSGLAYINVVIYGDDGGGHGMSPGEAFTLKLYQASSATTLTYGTALTGWQNTNFAPMPGYNTPATVYNFVTTSLSVTPANRDVSSTSGSTTFSLTSNTTWTVTDNVSWLSVGPASGSNNATLTGTYSSNTGAQRVATITITGAGVPVVTVTITQAAPTVNRTITIGSQNPNSGVPITVSPADNSGNANGTTQFTRTYANGTSVTLTAPSTAGGNVFQKWIKNSADHSTNLAITFSASANDNYTAVYTTPSSVTVSFPEVTIMAGQMVEIPVSVSDISGWEIISFQFEFSYDPAVISPVDPFLITDGTMAGAANWTVLPNNNTPGQMIVGGFGATALTGAGEMLIIKFEVVGSYGASTPLTFSSFTFNAGIPPVTMINGLVTIPPKVCGDADENGTIQAYDAALTLQHAIELITLSEQGTLNADVNEDFLVTAFDAGLTLREAIAMPMPQGVTTCFDSKNGYAEALPEKYNFAASLFNIGQSGNVTSADLRFRGIEETGKVYALSFDLIAPIAMISDLSFQGLPGGYVAFINPVSTHKYKVGIINTDGVLTSDLNLQLSLLGFSDGSRLAIGNIQLNDRRLPDIALTGNGMFNDIPQGSLLAYPNPFNSQTVINYLVSDQAGTRLEIFDQFGRLVKVLIDEKQELGYHSASWNGDNNTGGKLAKGIYLVKLTNGSYQEQIKITLIN